MAVESKLYGTGPAAYKNFKANCLRMTRLGYQLNREGKWVKA